MGPNAMINPRWFIQKETYPTLEQGRLNNLIQVLKEAGSEVHVDIYKPFGAMQFDFFDDNGPVVLHGSIELMRQFQAKAINWKPAVWMDEKILECKYYY